MNQAAAEKLFQRVVSDVGGDQRLRAAGSIRYCQDAEGRGTTFFTGQALDAVKLETKRVLGMDQEILLGSARDIPTAELVHRLWIFNREVIGR